MTFENTLDEMVEITMGQSPSGSTCNEEGVGIPLLNGPTEFGQHHPTPVQFTTDAKKTARPHDLLFCVRGSTTGRMNWADRQYAIGRGIASFRHKHGDEFHPFLRAVVEFHLPNLLAQATGSTFPNVSYKQLAGLRCRIPPLPQQKSIADILGSLDDKIELNRRTNETLEAMARAVFKSWFVDFDPVHAKSKGRQPDGMDAETAKLFPSSFVDSESGRVPKGWKPTPLTDLIEVNPYRKLPKGIVAPYLDMGGLPTRSARTETAIPRVFSSGSKFRNGDTLVARITPCLENGKTGFADGLDEGQVGWGSTEFIVLCPKEPIPPPYAYFLARTEEFRSFAIANMTGTSGRQRVVVDSLSHFLLPAPPADLGQRFGDFASAVLEQMKANDAEVATLSAIRDALLPRLLSGHLRVASPRTPKASA